MTTDDISHNVDSDGDPNIFNVEHDGNDLWLNYNYDNPDNLWNPDNHN